MIPYFKPMFFQTLNHDLLVIYKISLVGYHQHWKQNEIRQIEKWKKNEIRQNLLALHFVRKSFGKIF